LEELARYALVSDLGLRPVEAIEEGLQEHEGHLYFFDFSDLGILVVVSEVLGRLIFFCDLEALVSYDVPSSMLTRLAKILETSKLLKSKKVREISVYARSLEPVYLRLGDHYFKLNEEIDEESLESIAKLIEL